MVVEGVDEKQKDEDEKKIVDEVEDESQEEVENEDELEDEDQVEDNDKAPRADPRRKARGQNQQVHQIATLQQLRCPRLVVGIEEEVWPSKIVCCDTPLESESRHVTARAPFWDTSEAFRLRSKLWTDILMLKCASEDEKVCVEIRLQRGSGRVNKVNAEGGAWREESSREKMRGGIKGVVQVEQGAMLKCAPR